MRPSDHPLRARTRPAFDSGGGAVRIVDLFAGCGGITLGLAQACRAAGRALEIALADLDAVATRLNDQMPLVALPSGPQTRYARPQ